MPTRIWPSSGARNVAKTLRRHGIDSIDCRPTRITCRRCALFSGRGSGGWRGCEKVPAVSRRLLPRPQRWAQLQSRRSRRLAHAAPSAISARRWMSFPIRSGWCSRPPRWRCWSSSWLAALIVRSAAPPPRRPAANARARPRWRGCARPARTSETDEPYQFSIRVSDILRHYIGCAIQAPRHRADLAGIPGRDGGFALPLPMRKSIARAVPRAVRPDQIRAHRGLAADSRALLEQAVAFRERRTDNERPP